jgi:hypothetical protein
MQDICTTQSLDDSVPLQDFSFYKELSLLEEFLAT